MAMTRVAAGESGARPGPLGRGKAAGTTDRESAKGANGGGGCGGGGVWHWCLFQSQW